MNELLTGYENVKLRITAAVSRTDGLQAPLLLAVSKKHAVEKVSQLAEYGQRDFGESYVQEAVEKINQLQDLSLTWHFIGPIQSNKAKLIAENFHWVHSVDRLKVLKLLNKHRTDVQPPLNVLIQLKIGDEASKSGAIYDDVMSLARTADQFENIHLRGLMCIPPADDDFDVQCGYFRTAKSVFDELAVKYDTVDTLSMGMSGDLEAAVAQGSTLLRIGTDVFGPREP